MYFYSRENDLSITIHSSQTVLGIYARDELCFVPASLKSEFSLIISLYSIWIDARYAANHLYKILTIVTELVKHVTCTVDFKRLTRVEGLTAFYTSFDFRPKLDAIAMVCRRELS